MSQPAHSSPVSLQTTRVLKLLAQHEESQANAMRVAIQLGAALREIKAERGHGQWLTWLGEHWPRSIRRAQQYIEVADEDPTELQVDSLDAAVAIVRERRRQSRITSTRKLQVVTPDGERWRAEVGDARALPLDDGVAGMVIFSPPYNARLKYEGYEDWLPWDDWWEGLIVPSLREAARVLAPGGRLCLNLANVVRDDVGPALYTSSDGRDSRGKPRPNLRYRARGGKKWSPPPGAGGEPWAKLLARYVWQAIEDVGLLEREQLTWVKSDRAEGVVTTSTAWGSWRSPSNPVLRAVAEPVYVADKGSHSNERTGADSDLTEEEFKAWTRNAWFIPNEGGVVSRWGAHPAPFPTELPRRLVKLYSWPGDLIVDSFMGLAATGVAALRTGRNFYGCDISEVYVERARRRLAIEAARDPKA
jgi:DNA modification methylase